LGGLESSLTPFKITKAPSEPHRRGRARQYAAEQRKLTQKPAHFFLRQVPRRAIVGPQFFQRISCAVRSVMTASRCPAAKESSTGSRLPFKGCLCECVRAGNDRADVHLRDDAKWRRAHGSVLTSSASAACCELSVGADTALALLDRVGTESHIPIRSPRAAPGALRGCAALPCLEHA
jgi:hypothetical protein